MELVEIAEMGSTKGRLVTKRQFIDHSRELIQFQTVKKSHLKDNDEDTRRQRSLLKMRCLETMDDEGEVDSSVISDYKVH